MLEDRSEQEHLAIDPPPFFNTWSKMYGLVLGWLVLYVAIFYLFTEYYS